MLEVCNLRMAYAQHLVWEDLSFNVKKSQTLAILGPSGCGKSTLLLCIAGLKKYHGGNILLDHKPIDKVYNEVGLALQEHNLFPWLTVKKNLELGLITRGFSKEEIRLRVIETANDLGIEKLLERYPKTLSGGQKQRVAIGRILAYRPKVLLLDEPSSALDNITKEKFQDTLLDLKGRDTFTTLIVTHSVEEAVYLGDNIMVMTPKGEYTIHKNNVKNIKNKRMHLDFFDQCNILKSALARGVEKDEE